MVSLSCARCKDIWQANKQLGNRVKIKIVKKLLKSRHRQHSKWYLTHWNLNESNLIII
jgi:hypothetical protein